MTRRQNRRRSVGLRRTTGEEETMPGTASQAATRKLPGTIHKKQGK